MKDRMSKYKKKKGIGICKVTHTEGRRDADITGDKRTNERGRERKTKETTGSIRSVPCT